jgi:hypothetical protein
MIRATPLLFASVVVLASCSGKDEDTSFIGGDPPDVTGNYNVILGGVTGCDADPSWIQGWADGPLLISGEPDDLSFDFGDDIVLGGHVGATQDYSFFGTIVWNEADLSVANGGSFATEDGRWVMSGDFTVELDTDPEFESDNCTMTGPVEAYQLK